MNLLRNNNNSNGIDESFANYIERRLDEWALWFSVDSFGLGFPRRSIEHRLMVEGIIIKQCGPIPLPCNEDAEEIEALVCEMYKRNEKMAIALRIHYCSQRKSNDYSSHLKLASSRFRIYVDMARQWIAGRLSKYYR